MKYDEKIFRYLISIIIVIVAFLFINSGIDLQDSGYILNSYQFILSNPETTPMSIIFTSLTGNILLRLLNIINIPVFLGFKIIASITTLICVYVVYKTLEKYFNKTLILIGLLLAVVATKGFISIFMYNHTTTLLLVLSVAALIKGVLEDKQLFIFLSGVIIGVNIFMRIPNVVEVIIILSVIYWNLYKKNLKNTLQSIFNFILGFILSIVISLLIINSLFGLDNFNYMLISLSNKAQTSTDGHSIYDMIRANVILGFRGIIYLIILQIITLIIWIIIRNKKINKKLIYIISITSPIFYFIFKFIKLYNVPILSSILKPIYARTYTVITPITLIIVFLELYTLVILFKKNMHNEEQNFIIITIALMTLAIPIGSNNYFNLFIINIFFQSSIVISILGEILLKNYKKNENLIILEKANIIFIISYSIFMLVIYTINYSFGDIPRVYEKSINNKKLIGMYTTEERSSLINDILNNIPNNIREGTKIITHGDIPIFATLLDMPPFFEGCNGWSDLNGLSPQKIIDKLKESEANEEYPLIIICDLNKSIEMNKSKKLNYIYQYIKGNNYEKLYENNNFIIYYFN